MSDSSDPITEPKRLPSRGEHAAEGLLATGLGVGACQAFTRDGNRATTATTATKNRSQP